MRFRAASAPMKLHCKTVMIYHPHDPLDLLDDKSDEDESEDESDEEDEVPDPDVQDP